MKDSKFLEFRNFIIVLLVLGISSIFVINLAGQDYSGDEPDTVIISRSIFQYGIPSAWDGLNLVSLSNGLDFTKINDLYIWKWHPWLQFYLSAMGIFFGGDNVMATRMPFAIFGILTIVLLYFVSLEIFKNKFISFLLSMQLVFLLPFFLYARNVRYYSPGAFFTLLSLFLLLRYHQGKWGRISSVVFLLATFLLFHTNYLIWASTLFIAFVFWLLKKRRSLIFIIFFEVVFGAVWFLIFKPYGGNIGITSNLDWNLLANGMRYLSYINNYLFPLVFLPIFFFIRSSLSKIVLFLLLTVVVKLLFYSVFLIAHGRYLVDLMAIFIIFYGFIYQYLLKRGYWMACIIIFCITISTNFFNILLPAIAQPDKVKLEFWLPKYKIELMESYRTVMPELGKYFQERYRKGDLIWSNGLSYNYSKVPSISPLWDEKTDELRGPKSISDTDKIRWFVFFASGNNLQQILSGYHGLGEEWNDKLIKEYDAITFDYDNETFILNDGDIYNRQFPPGKFTGEIVIYEKKAKKDK